MKKLSILALLIVFPLTLFAFGEDVCFTSGGQYMNCLPLPASCPPGTASDTSDKCKQDFFKAMSEVQSKRDSIAGGRSVLHMDFVYYLGQFLGLSADDAYLVASYDQATDMSQYIPRGRNGLLLANPEECEKAPSLSTCHYITKKINGLNRMNILTGGYFYHFATPYVVPGTAEHSHLNGQEPDLSGESEVLLKSLRNRAQGAKVLCVHGLTLNGNDKCYGNGKERLKAQLYMFAKEDQEYVAPFTVKLGNQIINVDQNGKKTYADQFNSYIGEKDQLFARIGIYLHSYQDRISHHRCLDRSKLTGPTGNPKSAYLADQGTSDCDQTMHFIRHSWEIGVDQTQISKEDQNLKPALEQSYNELKKFIDALGETKSRANDLATRDAFINDYYLAMQIENPYKRVVKMSQLARQYSLKPLPGF